MSAKRSSTIACLKSPGLANIETDDLYVRAGTHFVCSSTYAASAITRVDAFQSCGSEDCGGVVLRADHACEACGNGLSAIVIPGGIEICNACNCGSTGLLRTIRATVDDYLLLRGKQWLKDRVTSTHPASGPDIIGRASYARPPNIAAPLHAGVGSRFVCSRTYEHGFGTARVDAFQCFDHQGQEGGALRLTHTCDASGFAPHATAFAGGINVHLAGDIESAVMLQLIRDTIDDYLKLTEKAWVEYRAAGHRNEKAPV
jgi:hypothetical protein